MGTIGGNVCLDTRCTYYNQTYFWRHALGFCLKKDGDVCHVTKVGKKCVAAHSADTAPVLMTLARRWTWRPPDGERSVPVDSFFVADGIENTVRGWNEIVTRIGVPRAGGAACARRSASCASAMPSTSRCLTWPWPLTSTRTARIADMRIVVSALGSRPRVVAGLDKVATGSILDDDTARGDIAQRAFQQCHPLTNIIVDPEWRRAMVPVQVRRTLRQLSAAPPA
jgi:4-hydroxybenzoyl-CoA reductase subunit beta